ncbi:hypothetical protein EXIGLDRAFT_336321 [Exidia glandulosa HHB12029]|uniref:Uncharacterized protein n=1 Tax=Exidia glandulosa HHB12029 TaxID=1314781 RepID=A0A165CLM8_EXIGL|nr:hypothetical protein EXIGLDRAFT_336321 [Exidia glandulosa HHB12029]
MSPSICASRRFRPVKILAVVRGSVMFGWPTSRHASTAHHGFVVAPNCDVDESRSHLTIRRRSSHSHCRDLSACSNLEPKSPSAPSTSGALDSTSPASSRTSVSNIGRHSLYTASRARLFAPRPCTHDSTPSASRDASIRLTSRLSVCSDFRALTYRYRNSVRHRHRGARSGRPRDAPVQ